MAIQFSEDMLDRMGESQRRQTLDMLKQLDEENKKQEQQKPFFRVLLYEEYGINRYFQLKGQIFEDKSKAIEFCDYVSYKKPVKRGKVEIVDNNGELVYKRLI